AVIKGRQRDSSLARGAVKRTALTDVAAPNRLAVARAGQAFAPVNGQLLLKITLAAIHTDVVTQGSAAGGNGVGQHLADGAGKARIAGGTDASSSALRGNARHVQGLAGVDVADP